MPKSTYCIHEQVGTNKLVSIAAPSSGLMGCVSVRHKLSRLSAEAHALQASLVQTGVPALG